MRVPEIDRDAWHWCVGNSGAQAAWYRRYVSNPSEFMVPRQPWAQRITEDQLAGE